MLFKVIFLSIKTDSASIFMSSSGRRALIVLLFHNNHFEQSFM